MRIRTWLFSSLAALLLGGCCCGCRSMSATTAEDVGDESGARGVGVEVLKAIQRGDFKKYVAATGEEMKTADEKEFQISCRELESKYGKIVDFKFVTFLKTPLVSNQIWSVGFERKDSKGGTVEQQQLFQLLLGKTDGRWHMLGMRFI